MTPSKDNDKDESKDAEHTQTELPMVALGQAAVASTGDKSPSVRLKPGRVAPGFIFYPMYLLIILSAGVAANQALDTDEWPFFIIVLTWFVIFMWNWMYGVAWSYRRKVFQSVCLFMALFMEACVGVLCLDRAAAQTVARKSILIQRPELVYLQWSGYLLFLTAILGLAHFFVLGRGYRTKKLAD